MGDFWRLVWEQQSHTLVMLTNCVESGRVRGAPGPGLGGPPSRLQPVILPQTRVPGRTLTQPRGFPARLHPSRLPQSTRWASYGAKLLWKT